MRYSYVVAGLAVSAVAKPYISIEISEASDLTNDEPHFSLSPWSSLSSRSRSWLAALWSDDGGEVDEERKRRHRHGGKHHRDHSHGHSHSRSHGSFLQHVLLGDDMETGGGRGGHDEMFTCKVAGVPNTEKCCEEADGSSSWDGSTVSFPLV
jgi:hypothetical protein